MYQAIKETLKLRFQHGFGQIFLVSELPTFQGLEPFLTMEQQRLWMSSLEQNDVQTIKHFYIASLPSKRIIIPTLFASI